MKKIISTCLLFIFSAGVVLASPSFHEISQKDAASMLKKHAEKVGWALEEVGLPRTSRALDGVTSRIGRPGFYTDVTVIRVGLCHDARGNSCEQVGCVQLKKHHRGIAAGITIIRASLTCDFN